MISNNRFDLIVEQKYGYMVGIKCNVAVEVRLEEVAKGQRTVPLDHPLIKAARSVATSFGDLLPSVPEEKS